MRIIGLDYGSKTVGVAATDALGLTVQPVETVTRREENKLRRTLARIEVLCRELEAGLIVVGLPLNMDETEGERAAKAREFGEKLSRRTGLPVEFEDERLTTEAADEVLEESGMRPEKRKAVIDQLAAVLILESYLSRTERKENG
ncbi:MAG: Holliday junction resolvase RuvX [Lachnospiraceae bacterium]|nr:Holliday junction resolvase RuvX [Lachnospiraceae bacterium]